MNLSIIIVSWKVKEKLEKNLSSLFASRTDYSFEVFVVDNDSDDGTIGMITEQFPQVKLIINDNNIGFSRANNQAIKKSQGEFVLLLNPDMQVFPDTINNVLKWSYGKKSADVIGCSLMNGDGNEVMEGNVRRFPRLFDQLAIVLKIPKVYQGSIKKYLYTDFDYNKEAVVDSVRGGFFLIRRATFGKILSEERIHKGEFLDERYFVWFEEVDFCKSVKETGGEVWYTPEAKCIDFVGQSFTQLPRLQTQKYFRDSQLKYFKKWHSYSEYLLLKTAWTFGILITLIFVKLGFENKKV